MQENIWFSLFSGNTFKTKSNHANFSSMVSIGIDQYVAQFGYNDFNWFSFLRYCPTSN